MNTTRFVFARPRARVAPLLLLALAAAGAFLHAGHGLARGEGDAPRAPAGPRVEVQEGAGFAYVVYHALDRNGFCDAAAFGAVSQHPVLTDAPNDTVYNPRTNQPSPRHTLDFIIDSGGGVIVETNAGGFSGRAAFGVPTYSIYTNARSGAPVTRTFPPLQAGAVDECQAWVKVVSASAAPTNVLVIVHDDLGDLAFDRVITAEQRTSVHRLQAQWNLLTWDGSDGVAAADALRGTGAAAGGSDVSRQVAALYAWDADRQAWAAFFPAAAGVPGANDLAALRAGSPYWVAMASGSGMVDWKVVTAP